MFSVYGLAMFLDPRFKYSFASNKDGFCRQIEQCIAEEIGQEDAMELDAAEFAPPVNQQPSSSNSIFELHSSFVGATHEQQPAKNVSVGQEILKYKAEQCLPLNSDPLAYWKVSKVIRKLVIFNCLGQRSCLPDFV
jgi:hypothetical protein